MDMKKYYAQLVGYTIVDFNFERLDGLINQPRIDEYGDGGEEPFPVFTLQLGDHKVKVTLSMDEEGNGGGFAFIEEVAQ
jgi:hypothetical protein